VAVSSSQISYEEKTILIFSEEEGGQYLVEVEVILLCFHAAVENLSCAGKFLFPPPFDVELWLSSLNGFILAPLPVLDPIYQY
jgi:hypothetical protein